jgi:hypothetical protein
MAPVLPAPRPAGDLGDFRGSQKRGVVQLFREGGQAVLHGECAQVGQHVQYPSILHCGTRVKNLPALEHNHHVNNGVRFG